MTKKPRPKVNVYNVLYEAVEAGIALGWRRAHKHTDAPSEETIKEAILGAIMNEMAERLEL